MAELLVEKSGHTTIFTINRPEKMNALSKTLLLDLAAGIKEFEEDRDQYVAIITGAGDRAFSSGKDLKEMADEAGGGVRMPISPGPDIAGIAGCEKVTIAAINGLAIAGGLELAISCDIRIASENAWFGAFEVKRGIVAGVAVNVLPRLMPIGAVMDLMLSGDRLMSDEALRLGLVQKVVTLDQLLEAALLKAEMIATNSQPAVWGTKQILKFWRNTLMAESQAYYESVMHRVLLTGDVHEGPRAFVEKRDPKFGNQWADPFNVDGNC